MAKRSESSNGTDAARVTAGVLPRERPPSSDGRAVWVVAIGSSAGGLAALQEFVGHLPADNNLAVIVAQHLHPEHPSLLVEILTRATPIQVIEGSDGMALAPGRIYVVPPNAQATIVQGVLRLEAADRNPTRRSIDRLFFALSRDAGERAAAVILSGSGADGSEGVTAVRAAGGMTFAQTEDSAEFGDMPRHAIATGCIDLVLPPAQIALELARIAAADASAGPVGRPARLPPHAGEPIDVERAIEILRVATGLDLGCLNVKHVERRIARRLLLARIERPSDYLTLLASSPAEVAILKSDLLIGVTSFFRDPEAFDALRQRVLPALVDHVGSEGALRIWVPGCASGEEVYSIAMALADSFEASGGHGRFQIFGTDLNDAAIATARAAVYREAALHDLPPDYLNRFFVRVVHGYQLVRSLRDRCVFAVHNAVTAPPFSRLDLISCRNLLIYVAPTVQQRLISTFHFALRPGGYLFLGGSESVGPGNDLFAPVDRKHRLFCRKPGRSRILGRAGTGTTEPLAADRFSPGQPQPPAKGEDLPTEAVAGALLDRFAPQDFVVVDSEFQILRFHGKVGRYLSPASGEATLNLLRLVDEDLALDLRLLLHRATAQSVTGMKRTTFFRTAGGERSRVTIEAIPVALRDESGTQLIVAFWPEALPTEVAPVAESPVADEAGAADVATRIHDLQDELAVARELLRQITEDQDTAREEVQATFLKRPESDVYFICEEGAAIGDQVRRALAAEERVTEPMHIQAAVRLPDGTFEPVAEFMLELSLKRKG